MLIHPAFPVRQFFCKKSRGNGAFPVAAAFWFMAFSDILARFYVKNVLPAVYANVLHVAHKGNLFAL